MTERRSIEQPDRGRTGFNHGNLQVAGPWVSGRLRTSLRPHRDTLTTLPWVGRRAMEGDNGYARPLDRLVGARRYRLHNIINHLKLARFKEIFPGAVKTDRRGLYKTVRFTIVTNDFYWRRINDWISVRGLDPPETAMFLNARTES
jgi:hypothetical protein